MEDAPFRFEEAVLQVVLRLSAHDCFPSRDTDALNRIASAWNGASGRQSGSCLGYAEALQLAMQFE